MMSNVPRRALSASLVVVAAGSIVIGVRAAQDSQASQTDPALVAQKLRRVPIEGPIATNVKPRLLDQTLVKVVAILAGDSVAQQQEVSGRRLTRQEKNIIKAQRGAEQAAVRTSLESAGGRVLNTFQSALNGIKLVIPRNRIDELRKIPGVVDVKPVGVYRHENVVSVPRLQAPIAWSGVLGVRGEGVKVAIIDTGIDYTHANFGGPGTAAAYQVAHLSETQPADPALFGPAAPKVVGGTDLVGDKYDPASDDPALNTPKPDPNPLDCNGHGSHVAGTAAGFGVTAQGTTFNGPYDQSTHTNFAFAIGPGVAPKADLYAVRVFGCEGATDVVTEAIEWAVDNDMDVINMSLGADFGTGDNADSLAADNAMKAGVVVVIAAGNAGDIRYVLGAPGASAKSITVAASAKEAFDTTVNMALPAVPATGAAAKTIQAINANGAAFSPGSLQVKVLRNPNGTVSLGCNPAEYVNAGVTGMLVVTQRGTCARVARAIFGQQAGAAAVVMINNATTLPPFEGPITSNPDTGEPFVVTIPFYGVRGLAASATSDGFALVQRDGLSIALTEGTSIQTGLAAFTSGGPRTPDSLLKPDITAPGVSIVSTAVGSGNGALTLSGTSMATPHVAGMAALVIQAHPKWRPAAIKSAIINSGDPSGLSDYETRRAGSGFASAAAAVGTMAYAFADRDETTVNFGFDEFSTDFSKQRTIRLKNDGAAANFDVTVQNKQGSPHTVLVSPTHISVPKGGTAQVELTLTVPAATAGGSLANPPADVDAFHDVAGLVTFTPSSGSNRGIALRVPYYLVPRPSANVSTNLTLKRRATIGVANVQNRNSAIAGTADFYAWGLESANDKLGRIDLRAAGVQALDLNPDKVVVFAVNTFRGWSTPEQQEFDVPVDVNGDGNPDFLIFNLDLGLATTGDFNGQMVAAIVNLNTGDLFADFFSVAATNSSTILLPVLSSTLGITPANPRLTYAVVAFDRLSNDSDAFEGAASFNVFTPAISNGDFVVVDPDGFVSVAVTLNPAEAAITPARGLMIVTQDNKNGPKEADLIAVRQ
jgi:minor extracellular serine protease Vpr